MNKLKSRIHRYPVIFSIIIMFLMSVLTEIKLENLLTDKIEYQAAFYIRIALTQGLVAIAAASIISKLSILKSAGLTKPSPVKSIWLLWPIAIMSVFNGFSLLDGTLKIDFSRPLVDILFLLAPITTGFVEELICRGFVLTVMLDKYGSTKKGVYKAVLLSSVLFGVLHFMNLLTGRGTFIQVGSQVLYAVFFGVFFAAIFIRCNSLWPAIVAHIVFDFMGSVEEISVGSTFNNTMGGNASWQSALTSLAILSPLFFYGLFLLRKAPFLENAPEVPAKA